MIAYGKVSVAGAFSALSVVDVGGFFGADILCTIAVDRMSACGVVCDVDQTVMDSAGMDFWAGVELALYDDGSGRVVGMALWGWASPIDVVWRAAAA